MYQPDFARYAAFDEQYFHIFQLCVLGNSSVKMVKVNQIFNAFMNIYN